MPTSAALPWATALVTGASSGIGEAICRELAGRPGLRRLVVVARRADRLEDLAASLAGAGGHAASVEVEVLAADLVDVVGRAAVAARLAEPDGDQPVVSLLVNNAGLGTAGPFWGLDPDGEQREIDLNVSVPVALTRAALAGMVQRGAGAVLNVSSMATYQPTPGMATYAGTKAFVTLFTESLHEELRGTGVTTTALLPGYTRTEFQDHVGTGGYDEAPRFAWMEASAVARAAIDDTVAGKALSVPGAGYKAATALLTPIPRNGRRWLMGRVSKFER